jgi:Flp pilus assembly pilin Flp
MLRSLMRKGVRDRRGVGVAEYALLLFIVLVVCAVTYKYVGGRVKHAGNKTEEQFAAQGGQGNGNGAGGNAAGGNGAHGANGTDNGAGGNAAGGAGGGGGGKAGGGGAGGGQNGSGGQDNNGALEQAEDARGVPLWKIIGGVFIILFAIGGYFAFRKQKSSG